MIARYENWPELLHNFLDWAQSEPFGWGVRDCATFTCDAVLVMTGVDLAAGFRGKYTTELGAAKVMREFADAGLEAVADKITQEYGLPEIPVAMAARGDIALVDGEKEPALGIVALDGVFAVTVTPQGLQRWPALSCRRAWRVGACPS